jgi:hypothetical protein
VKKFVIVVEYLSGLPKTFVCQIQASFLYTAWPSPDCKAKTSDADLQKAVNAFAMASLSPRVSGLWADHANVRMRSFDVDEEVESDDVEQQRLIPDHDLGDGRTPLDKTIDRIGMGELNRGDVGCTGYMRFL